MNYNPVGGRNKTKRKKEEFIPPPWAAASGRPDKANVIKYQNNIKNKATAKKKKRSTLILPGVGPSWQPSRLERPDRRQYARENPQSIRATRLPVCKTIIEKKNTKKHSCITNSFQVNNCTAFTMCTGSLRHQHSPAPLCAKT